MKLKKTICSIGLVVASVTGMYTYNEYGEATGVNTEQTTYTAPRSATGNPLRYSAFALDLIAKSEGCRQDSYYCPAGKLTVGVGSTGKVEYRLYGLDEIAYRFASDLISSQNCIEQLESKIGEPLPQPVFDAMGDMAFNTGCTNFKSYPVYRLLLDKKYKEACERIKLYNKGGGKTLPGLVERRTKFSEYCQTYKDR